MFETLAAAPPDAILGITEAFLKDTNPAKINLSVGIYQDAEGQTPVLAAVKQAEQLLLRDETTKKYLGIDGAIDYRHHVRRMVFGETFEADRVAVVQTPGGTAAVRLAADFLQTAMPQTTIWHSNPTWANHASIFASAGLGIETYPYLNAERTGLDFPAVLDALQNGPRPGDCVLLHACCHNPTGVDPTLEQWSELASLLADRKLVPLVDFAYQGFGEGLEEDAQGLKRVLEVCPEVLVASSFSKNFGLYSERVGALSLTTNSAETTTIGLSQLKRLVRSNYSNPPRHGAAIVSAILDDADLTTLWKSELTAMRERIADMRTAFVAGMRERLPDADYSFLLNQKGMFSFSGLSPLQVDRLKSEHSVYIVGSGRINVAGITPTNLPQLCDAIAAVTSS